MPKNNGLTPIDYPVDTKFDQEPETLIKEQLSSINVTLLSIPSLEELAQYIPEFSTATWSDYPGDKLDPTQSMDVVDDMFAGHVLPTALETVNVVFRIDGLDLTDATHLIRHRAFSFSAQCTGDRDLRCDDVVVKPGIFMQPNFYQRYIKLMEDAKQLYADMVDSREVSIMDARSVLPRSLASFYYVRGNLKDVLGFIRTRLDEQIQPMSDNVIAMKLYLELVRVYPQLKGACTIGGRDEWYIKTARTGRNSNIYPPKPENDVFDYHEADFLYGKLRSEFSGSFIYDNIKKEIIEQLEAL